MRNVYVIVSTRRPSSLLMLFIFVLMYKRLLSFLRKSSVDKLPFLSRRKMTGRDLRTTLLNHSFILTRHRNQSFIRKNLIVFLSSLVFFFLRMIYPDRITTHETIRSCEKRKLASWVPITFYVLGDYSFPPPRTPGICARAFISRRKLQMTK